MRALRLLLPLVTLLACSSEGGGGGGGPLIGGGTGGNGGTFGTDNPAGKGGSSTTGGSGGAGLFGSGGSGTSAGAGGSNTAGAGGTASAGSSAGGGAGASGQTNGVQYPLTLTPLTQPQTSTANISLFFSLTDAVGQPVTGFGAEDFEVREDNAPIAKNESDFQADPLSGQTLDVPTVILLDLSGSIVAGGALEKLKQAALAIVDGAFPEQRLSLISFADTTKVRVPFTKDKAALKEAIAAISDKDGLSTNLYGAISTALTKWSDGFVGTGSTGRLTSGFVLVVTDGTDTAAVKKLDEVVAQRGSKRIVTVGVGEDVNVAALKTLGNAGYIASTSFDTLLSDVAKINATTQALGKSIYRASYCSPKLAGQHELLFYPKGNPTPADGSASCDLPSLNTEGSYYCDDEGFVPCGQLSGSSSFTCCPGESPYGCGVTGKCYKTAAAAVAACGTSSCVACQFPSEGGNQLASGPYLQVDFNANGHSTSQCPAAWGTECKGLATCCATLPDDSAQQCSNYLVGYKGDESSCAARAQQYCPEYTGACADAKACCESLADTNQRNNCLSEAASYASNDSQDGCGSLTQQRCPAYTGTCATAKACCESLVGTEQRSDCLGQAASYASQSAQTSCSYLTTQYCPANGEACQTLAVCCEAYGSTPAGLACQKVATGGSGESCLNAQPSYCGG